MRLLRLSRFACGVGALVVLSSCGSSAPTSPSTQSIAGNWTGAIINTVPAGQPNGNVVFTLAQTGSNLSGTWSTTYASSPSSNNAGTLTGSLSGSGGTFTLSPSNPTLCPYSATSTISGNSMTGTFSAFNCTIAIAGSFSVTKRVP